MALNFIQHFFPPAWLLSSHLLYFAIFSFLCREVKCLLWLGPIFSQPRGPTLVNLALSPSVPSRLCSYFSFLFESPFQHLQCAKVKSRQIFKVRVTKTSLQSPAFFTLPVIQRKIRLVAIKNVEHWFQSTSWMVSTFIKVTVHS